MSDLAIRVEIRGKVQGVWYRGWTVDKASSKGLRGWVRNRRGGSVEAMFIGPSASVEAMVDACREGPPAARVDSVLRFQVPDDGSTGFEQKPTV